MSCQLIRDIPFTLYSIPPGKPDSNALWIEGQELPLVEQSAQKGSTCLQYAIYQIVQRYGKKCPPAFAEARSIEKRCSDFRKNQTRLELKYDIDIVKALLVGIVDSPTPEAIKKAMPFIESSRASLLQSLEEGSEELSSLRIKIDTALEILKKFSEQSRFKNLSNYFNEIYAEDFLRVYDQFFESMQVDPKVLYKNRMKAEAIWMHFIEPEVPFGSEEQALLKRVCEAAKSYESLTTKEKRHFAAVASHLVLHKAFHFKPIDWDPYETIDPLEEALKMHGPLLVHGHFGRTFYKTEPKIKKQVAGRSIYSWEKNDARKIDNEISHAIVVIGIEKGDSPSGRVYYQDPNDKRDPKNPGEAPIYGVFYSNFRTRVKPMLDVPLAAQNELELYNSTVNAYAYYWDIPK